MRTNIEIDDKLMKDALKATGAKTKREAVELGLGQSRLAVGDLIAAEVLQGVRDEREFDWVKKTLDAFDHIDLVGYDLAVKASENDRSLRSLGVTIRKTIDTLIATRCIQDDLSLLHADPAYLPFAEHLGLKEAYRET